jgi:O-methyltransferase
MLDLLRFVRNSASAEPNRKVAALQTFSKWLFGDYRLTWSQMAWWSDEDFNAYLCRFHEQDGLNTHRKWMLWQLLRLTSEVQGHTAECGVFEGASSWLICAWNARAAPAGRVHHLFDSFEGVSTPEPVDGSHWKKSDLSASVEVVAKNLLPFKDVIRFHKGWIPERFADVDQTRFTFVHVDVDLFQPTRDSVEFFYPRLSQGGVLLCDDYGFTSCPGATEAIDNFLADKPEKMLSLPSGGGFFIKGCATGSPGEALRGFEV